MKRIVADAPDTPGHPEHAHWETVTWDDGHHVHVVPLNDGVQHSEDPDGDCICGPTVEAEDDGWLIVHHSIDNRERFE